MISAANLACRLARDAEAVCRHYLSNGRRAGRYWIAGDVRNTPGRSLYVRLHGPERGPGAAGKWTDSATGQHGDLLDLIALNRDLVWPVKAMAEAHAFLGLPKRSVTSGPDPGVMRAAPSGSSEAARRLFRIGRPIPGTPAEAYLRARGIDGRLDWPTLRFHPSVYYRAAPGAPLETWPVLLGAVTDFDGRITGILRTWLDRAHPVKAPVTDPRRALGCLLGNGVRFGSAGAVMAVGEGIETMLALNTALPFLPIIAGLSASHLGALAFPPALRRFYIARDNDAAGLAAARRLSERAGAAGIEARDLVPIHTDFNLDLCRLGLAGMRAYLARQLAPDDFVRFAGEDHRGRGCPAEPVPE